METEEKKVLALGLAVAITVTSIICYTIYITDFSLINFVNSNRFILLFTFLFVMIFTYLSLETDNSLIKNLLISLIMSSIITLIMLLAAVRMEEIQSNDEQRYECRISGGSFEYFGERGWVCIKPTTES